MKWLTKTFKILAITSLIFFVGLFTYANWNPPRMAHGAAKAEFLTYDLPANLNNQDSINLLQAFTGTDAVTAVSVNKTSKLLCIGYKPAQITVAAIGNTLSNTGIKMVQHQWVNDPSKPQCPAPVHGMLAWLDDVKSALCVR
jgi:hypothetical protein